MISTTALVKLPITVDKLAVSFMKLTVARRRSVDEPERKATRLMRQKNAEFRVSGYSRWAVKAGKTWRNMRMFRAPSRAKEGVRVTRAVDRGKSRCGFDRGSATSRLGMRGQREHEKKAVLRLDRAR